MSHLEIELKTLLTVEHFHQLMQYFGLDCQQPLVQHNTYYDTPSSQLKQLNAALRLRQFAKSSEWTIKQRLSATHALELIQHNGSRYDEVPTSLDATHLTDEAVASFLSRANIALEHLHPTISLSTERWEIPLTMGTYCLDRSTFGTVVDYELEFETTNLDDAQREFDQLLARLNIPYTPAPKKIARAFQYAR